MFFTFNVTSSSNVYGAHIPLEQLCEDEIRRLRSESQVLKLQNNLQVIHLNAALAQQH